MAASRQTLCSCGLLSFPSLGTGVKLLPTRKMTNKTSACSAAKMFTGLSHGAMVCPTQRLTPARRMTKQTCSGPRLRAPKGNAACGKSRSAARS
jgi:hypothetical protein